jgi:hypothetical protein
MVKSSEVPHILPSHGNSQGARLPGRSENVVPLLEVSTEPLEFQKIFALRAMGGSSSDVITAKGFKAIVPMQFRDFPAMVEYSRYIPMKSHESLES